MPKELLTFCSILLFLTAVLLAQSQARTAELSGTITDESGGVIPGAQVTAENLETGLSRSVITGEDGIYRIPLLPPGPYEVRVEMAGFSTKINRGVVLTVGQFAELDVSLEVSPTQTEVVVQANAEIIEKESTVQSSTIDETQIDNLPINGRNYLEFTLLTPGTASQNSLLTFSAVQTPTSGLSFSGQDQRSNFVAIDGADNMDIISNSVRSTLSQEAIQEFQINRNSFSAEFGRARGGVLNIVSKSGTNEFHGNAFFFFRNNALDATNAFAQIEDPPFERYEFGGTLGGPIVEDQTFFFASFERQDREESIFVTFLDDPSIFRATPSQLELFGFLASTGIPSLQFLSVAFVNEQVGVLNTTVNNFPGTLALFESESGIFPLEADQDVFSLKLDHQFSQDNSFFARFNFGDSFNDGVNFGALQGVSNGVSFDTRDWALVASDTHIFSPSRLNDFRFQYARREFTVDTNDPVGPEIIISGVAEFGREFFNPTAYDENIFQLTDNFTLIKGKHSIKSGIDFVGMTLDGFAEVFLGGQFSFGEAIPLALIIDNALGTGTAAGLINQLAMPTAAGGLGRPELIPNVLAPISAVQSFNFGLPITYFQGFGDPNTSVNYYNLGLFVQDNWRVTENFNINLGLRYDTEWRPETLNVTSVQAPWSFQLFSTDDRNNFGPRVGFAWDALNRGETVIRGGYGLYYQSLFQATAFVSQVLSGQISQVFLPLTGLPGLDVTSADVWSLFLQNGEVGADTLQALGVVPGVTPSVILPGNPNVVNPYSHHASFGIEQQMGQDWALSLDYLLNRGVHLIRSRDINVRQVAPGVNQFALPGLDPRFIQVNTIETSGSSIYHGFTASLRKRFSQNFSLLSSYTFGKAIDDTIDFITQYQPNNQRNIAAERSLSAFDQRHRFVFSGVFQSPYRLSSGNSFIRNILSDWTVAPIITWAGGRPFNLRTGFDANNDTHEETDRPIFTNGDIVGRNTGQGPSFFATNLRLSRKFWLQREEMNFEFLMEAFNLFNNVNYSGVNNVVGLSPLMTSEVEGSENIPANQPLGFTSAFDPRQIQFGFRFNF